MMEMLRKILHHHGDHMLDAVNEARLLDAERELRGLKFRAGVATRKIDARQRQNHWQEAINQIIQRGHT